MNLLNKLSAQLPSLYENSSCDHGLDHALRVTRNATIIGKKEHAELTVLLPAAMLHDIALKQGTLPETNSKHAILCATMANDILKKLSFPKNQIKRLCSTIKQHSLDNPTDEPRTLEGNCLFDADKLDAINANGLARYLQERALFKNTLPSEAAKNYMTLMKTFQFKTSTGRNLEEDREPLIDFCQAIIQSAKI